MPLGANAAQQGTTATHEAPRTWGLMLWWLE